METVSVGITNLCAACRCMCRYCLLDSRRETSGVEYFRGKKLAERFAAWAHTVHAAEIPWYFIGYCSEYPELFDNIAYNRSIGWQGASFLQMNGVALRSASDTDAFMEKLAAAGIDKIDITFFGDEQYHDRFAGRAGDYAYMLRMAKSAAEHGIRCLPSVPVTEENTRMLASLFDTLTAYADAEDIHVFLPDYRGRGSRIESIRLKEASLSAIPDEVKRRIHLKQYKTEREWLSLAELPEFTRREVTITLRADNIDMFEQMSCEEIIACVEGLDDAFYRAVPSGNELAGLYGDAENTRLYRLRDLYWKWQRRYIREHNLSLYDVTDERLCNTVRR